MSATSTFQDPHTRSEGGQAATDCAGGRHHGPAGGHLRLVPDDAPRARPADRPAPLHTRPADRPAPLRLTRRGRLVVFGMPLVLLAALVLSFGGFFNAPAKAADSASELVATPTVTVTVQPGDSLWAIAGAVSPERDPRDVVADIVQLNNLDAGRVMPGQQLFVPTS